MNKVTLTDGSPVSEDHREIDPVTGMQKGYVVLSEEERAKGFIRPIRYSYRHVGARPKYPLLPLTDEQKDRVGDQYKFYEEYPKSESPKVGRYWTEQELNSGCGTVTTMNKSIAETYARDPHFYGGTFCAHCLQHFKVGENGEFVWDGTDERVGT